MTDSIKVMTGGYGYTTIDDMDAKIDAARLEGIRLGLEAAARACQAQAEEFLSPSYAVNQPLSSFAERFACGRCADEIRALNPDTIAREAQDMGSDTSAGTTA